MGKAIEVILLEDVEDLGRSGDTCRVRAGYARNFLFPRKKAVSMTPGTKRLIEQKRAEALVRQAAEKEAAEKLLGILDGMVLTCPVKANAEGRLFGSVGSSDVLAALKKEGYELTRRQVSVPEAFKTVGEHEVPFQLHADVRGTLKVKVVADTAADSGE